MSGLEPCSGGLWLELRDNSCCQCGLGNVLQAPGAGGSHLWNGGAGGGSSRHSARGENGLWAGCPPHLGHLPPTVCSPSPCPLACLLACPLPPHPGWSPGALPPQLHCSDPKSPAHERPNRPTGREAPRSGQRWEWELLSAEVTEETSSECPNQPWGPQGHALGSPKTLQLPKSPEARSQLEGTQPFLQAPHKPQDLASQATLKTTRVGALLPPSLGSNQKTCAGSLYGWF